MRLYWVAKIKTALLYGRIKKHLEILYARIKRHLEIWDIWASSTTEKWPVKVAAFVGLIKPSSWWLAELHHDYTDAFDQAAENIRKIIESMRLFTCTFAEVARQLGNLEELANTTQAGGCDDNND